MANETDSPVGIAWRKANRVTDWELQKIGVLLCVHEPRELALMVIRLQGQMDVERMLRGVKPVHG